MPKAVMESGDSIQKFGKEPIVDQDLVGYLTSKGLDVKRSKGAEVCASCFNCQDPDPRKRKMYFNTESWLYSCFVCGTAGNRKTLLAHFGDEDGLAYAEGQDPMLRRRIYTDAAELAHTFLLGNEEQCQYLLDRGISEQMILGRKYGYVPKNVGFGQMLKDQHGYSYKDLIAVGLLGQGGQETFNHSLVIPYWTHGTVIQLRSKELRWTPESGTPKYRTLANDRSRIYNGDALQNATEALVVEGEYDTDAILSALSKGNDRQLDSLAVVGVAGAGSWPDELISILSRLDKVFIGFDPDDTGKRFTKKMVEELGTKARPVSLPEDVLQPDWSDFLSAKTAKNPHGGHDWRDVRDLLIEADLAGKRVFSMRDASTKWKRLQSEAPGLKLGFPSLDAVIRPGLKPGQVMIPLAGTGAGKTVWMSNVAWNVRQEGVLYVSLEMTASEVFEHFRRIHRFWHPAGSNEELLEATSKIKIVEENRIRKGDLEEYLSEYRELVGHKPGLMLIDYLQYYSRGFPGNSAYDRNTDAIMEVKAVSKSEMIPTIVPSQVSRKGEPGRPLMLNDARDAGSIEETGDFVASLFRPEMAITRDDPAPKTAPTGNTNMQILKSRHGGVGRMSNLRMSPLSLVVVDSLDRKAAMRVEQEVSMANQGVHYEDYRRQVEAASGQGVILP